MSFTAEGLLYTSETCHASAAKISVIFWFFPLLSRQTAGPWTNVEIEDCRLRIMRSNATPYWIKRLRQNLVGAVVAGEIFRVDDFKTSVRFQSMSDNTVGTKESCEDDNEHDGEHSTESVAYGCPGSMPGDDTDELRLSASARGLQLHNLEGRIYSFGSVDAVLRRNWIVDRGTFAMVAEESRWIRVPWTYQTACTYPWWMQLASSVAHFPYDLVHVLNYPMTTVNLYIARIDITFDEFKIRDAELAMQAISLIRERMALKDIDWQDVFVDFLADVALGHFRARD
ncbi:hypothetical protein NM688_g5339 [Phlebia brevispora]|uniref:Uncharacterized protein n=1 Tax=Phlebia brevispora TaxID=194682 RepID=A0ACC1SWZ2_9APHY|nr:hypothetical protein NM688_g5339 [Phlebia brevispora]